ncbi:hypothetical protein D8676_19575 [Mesorhizobium sp. YM1C-6-2]|nr:hypothetical protein D8676_19575 [Mesorhizobium sp. YM1C-6-2]
MISGCRIRRVTFVAGFRTKESTMKTVLVLAAALGLSISAASADCAAHKQVNASADTGTKVASVAKEMPPVPVSESAKAEEKQAE